MTRAMRTSMRPTTAWTTTRATCTSPEYALRARNLCHTFIVSHAPHGSSLSLVTCHPCTCASLLEFDFLLFYFDLSFPVFFSSSHFLHFELHAHWARQPDRHAKPALFLEQGEWRRLRRPHLPHIVWTPESKSSTSTPKTNLLTS